ncbi:hypothetical protein FOZ60_005575 [Perkinsus olseni]|uniref:Uncharacterized protein n=1 Tax=Perkinsus olseni TaxID=32597 RepID=A0A7J6NQQ5_PEROL|nr:hypothetical protein FOZ60_005575 [Perkinsus olseni]
MPYGYDRAIDSSFIPEALRSLLDTPTTSVCSSEEFCEVDSNNHPDILPAGNVSVVTYTSTSTGVWYIAGTEDGVGKLWRAPIAGRTKHEVVADKDFSDIQASNDGKVIYGISDGAVYAVNPANRDVLVLIAPTEPSKGYTGVAFDDQKDILYVTGKASNKIYAFSHRGQDYHAVRTITNSALKEPTSIRFLNDALYVRLAEGGVISLDPNGSEDQTPVMPTTSSALPTTTGPTKAMTTHGQCGPDFCEVDSNNHPDILPAGNVSVVTYTSTSTGVWYIAGTEDGVGKLWRAPIAGRSKHEVVADKDFSDIQASNDGKVIYGISDGAVYAVNPANRDVLVLIAPTEPSKGYTGVAFDDQKDILYVTGKASNKIYAFSHRGQDYHAVRTITNSALKEPTSIRFLNDALYVRLAEGGVISLDPNGSEDQTPVMPTTSSALPTTTGPTKAMTTHGQCGPDFCEVDSNNHPGILPAGNVSVVTYTSTSTGVWYIAGTEDGVGKLWRAPIAGRRKHEVVVDNDFSDIQASNDGKVIYGISDGAVYAVNPVNRNVLVLIAPAEPSKGYTGVAFDDQEDILYVTGKASNKIYAFSHREQDYHAVRTITNSALKEPTSIRFLNDTLYVRLAEGGVISLDPNGSEDQTPVMYTDLGIPEAADCIASTNLYSLVDYSSSSSLS